MSADTKPVTFKVEIELQHIIIVRARHGTDKLHLVTTMPEGTYPWTEPGRLIIDVARGLAEAYVIAHFHGVKTLMLDLDDIGPVHGLRYPMVHSDEDLLPALDWSRIPRMPWVPPGQS